MYIFIKYLVFSNVYERRTEIKTTHCGPNSDLQIVRAASLCSSVLEQ